ncbi:anaerobic ribonucleoside-triphosphate reductase activating protein [bacterium]|nr:anaerobic ribonucleoside-triphosphate reductase activating protein [bacterium]
MTMILDKALGQIITPIEIKGFIKNTLLDWEGKIASILFLPCCNFKCSYCHSASLVKNPRSLETIELEEVLNFLQTKKGWIDGVVITGGEPTLYDDLPQFIRQFKQLGFLIKLDTNGANPEMLKYLLSEKLVDYISMDIKAPLVSEKYKKIADVDIDIENIKDSISMIMKSNIGYEFRTTLARDWLSVNDMVEIAKFIKGAYRYRIQKFKNAKDNMINNNLEVLNDYTEEEIEDIVRQVRQYVTDTKVR